MAKANSLNISLTNCTGLPLSTGVAGNISISSLSNGTNASASTYYTSEGWYPAPVVNAGAQNSLAYYASNSTALSALAGVANSIFIGGATPSWSPMSDGQIPIAASSGTRWVVGNITGSNGIQITNGPNSITVSYVYPMTNVTGTSQAMSVMNGYLANNASLVTLTLPASSFAGDTIKIVGVNSGGWKIAQNSGQSIIVGSAQSTVGTGGSVSSASGTDSINLMCLTTNAIWAVIGAPQSTGLVVV